MSKLNFGTAGNPLSSISRKIIDGLPEIKKLDLDCMELEFVRRVYIDEKQAKAIKSIAKNLDVKLTCHGSYYVNLNSKDPQKQEASKARILEAAKIADLAGATSITFHPGFYHNGDAYPNIKKNMAELGKQLKINKLNIKLRPETTGKKSQFGSFNDLVKLHQDLKVLPCFDFAHLYAREGKLNSYPQFHNLFVKIEKEFDCLKNMHIHMSGINYGDKGERNHMILKESDFGWKDLIKCFKEFNIKGNVICESPNLEEDAILMKNEYEKS